MIFYVLRPEQEKADLKIQTLLFKVPNTANNCSVPEVLIGNSKLPSNETGFYAFDFSLCEPSLVQLPNKS